MKPGEFGVIRERLIADCAALTGATEAVLRRLSWARLNLLALQLGVL